MATFKALKGLLRIRLRRKRNMRSCKVRRELLKKTLRQHKLEIRAAENRVPDDVYAHHIFSKLSLQALIQIQLTCSRWNRVISDYVLQGLDLKKCMVQVVCSVQDSRSLAFAHNPIDGVWRRIMWPSLARIGSSSRQMFYQGDGPFVVQVSFESTYWVDRSIRRPVFVVHNVVTRTHHPLPEPEPVPPRSNCNFDRRLRLFDASQVGYKAVLISLITPCDARYPLTSGHLYTHVYTSLTDSWRMISCTDIDIGTRANGWPAREHIRPWLRAGCFDGSSRFFFLKCNLSPGNFETEIRLWVFHTQTQGWNYIPTYEIYTCGPPYMFRIKYLICMGKLLAVAPYLDFEGTAAGGKPRMRIIIFQFSGSELHRVTGRSWRELSRMPLHLTTPKLTENFTNTESFAFKTNLYFPVVNEVIYIAPIEIRGNSPLRREYVMYNFHENSWKLSSLCRFDRYGTGSAMTLPSGYAIPC